MKVERGDVIIADYSHALTGTSLRPALVVQAEDYNRKITNTIVAQITTNLKNQGDLAHLFIDVATEAGQQSGLLHDSLVSCINLNTLDQQRVRKVIGRLPDDVMQQINDCLRAALDLY
jgi:mRNA interferase MazF